MDLNSAERLKLATAENPSLSASIQVVYIRLNQIEWVSPFVHSKYNLDSVVGAGAQGQQKIYNSYGLFIQKTN